MICSRQSVKILLIATGFSLAIAGGVVGYWWCYLLVPLRHMTDPDWLASHSEEARWSVEQQYYHRLENAPDLCFRGDRIGYYGDEEWFYWLEEKIRNPEKFRHCGCTAYALTLMANQDAESWEQWARTNRSKSQLEWIRDGFQTFGVMVHIPPEPEEVLPLIRLLGRRSWSYLYGGPQGTNAPGAIPSYIQYNAFRWLRDSDFNPGGFASTNSVLLAQPEISKGLVSFSQWEAAYPGRHGLGVLELGRIDDYDYSLRKPPAVFRPWIAGGISVVIVIVTLAGLGLALWGFRKKVDLKAVEPRAE